MISIVCPAYNREKYITQTIDSILNQTYKDFELIIVDDGSTDSTLNIITEYAKKDSRIKAIHQENGGASSARYNGYLNASGEYFTLLDSDDLWKDTLLENQVKLMETGSYDYVCCCLREMSNEEIEKESLVFNEECIIKEYSGIELYKKSSMEGGIATSWAVLFNKHYFDKEMERFISIRDKYPYGFFNDSFTSAQLLCMGNKIALINNVFVLVRINADSICRTVKILPHNLEKIYHFQKKVEFLKVLEDKYPYGHELIGMLLTDIGIWVRIKYHGNDSDKKYLKIIESTCTEYYDEMKRVDLELKDRALRFVVIMWRYFPNIMGYFIKKVRNL